MIYRDFLHDAIDRSIVAARKSYANAHPGQLEGALAGFAACRDKSPLQLHNLLQRARRAMAKIHWGNTDLSVKRGWWVRCYHAEVEWICNVVSAVLVNQNYPPIADHLPTARALLFAGTIAGVHDGHGVVPT